MIHWNLIVYFIIAVPLVAYAIIDFCSETNSSLFYGGKNKFDLGLGSFILIIFVIIWTLIWGGFFWW